MPSASRKDDSGCRSGLATRGSPGWLRALWLAGVAGLAVGLGAWGVRGDDGTEAGGRTTIPHVKAILRNPSRTNAVPVRFEGVVTYVEPPSVVCLQAENAALLVQLPDGMMIPGIADRAEVESEAVFKAAGAALPLVATAARNLGPGTLPKPLRPWLLDALNGEYDNRWLEVEGVVMQARQENDTLLIHMTDKSGWAIATVYRWLGDQPLTNWWGARLRVRGANIGKGHKAIRVPSAAFVEVLRPGAPSLFEAPRVDPLRLRSMATNSDRVRLQGLVLAVEGERIQLRCGTVGARATYLQPFDSGSSDPGRLELIPGPTPSLRPGSEVELVGSVLGPGAELVLNFCSFRVMAEGPPPDPRPIAPAELVRGGALNDLVRLSAKLIARERSPAKTRGIVETLALEQDGVSFLATFESLQGGRLDFLNVGDVVEVAGVVDAVPGKPAFALRLRSPSDARTVWVAPSVARERLVRIVGLSMVLLLAAGGWIAFLRFKLAERDRAATAMSAANDALEQHVRERTRELEAAKEELGRRLVREQELNELKSRFVSMVSHEFRTPLGIIMSSAEILDAYLDRLPPEQRRANLQDIFQSTRHMASMMEQVLLLGRVEAGRMKFVPSALCLRTLCLKLVDEVTSATGGRSPIRLEIPGGMPDGHGDEALIRHILTNLLSNAVKYSPPGSPVDVAVSAKAPDVTLRVSDRGIGITEADGPLLFQAFHRGRNVGDVPGTGLGMVIVKHCVDLHGGRIRFEPREGGGTTFEVVLPLLNPKTS